VVGEPDIHSLFLSHPLIFSSGFQTVGKPGDDFKIGPAAAIDNVIITGTGDDDQLLTGYGIAEQCRRSAPRRFFHTPDNPSPEGSNPVADKRERGLADSVIGSP
jgi:hypothetical protein